MAKQATDIEVLDKKLIRSEDARFLGFKKVDEDIKALKEENEKLKVMVASLAAQVGKLQPPPKHVEWFDAPNEGLPI